MGEKNKKMKSNEQKNTSSDSSENKEKSNKPVLFTIQSPNNELLKKKGSK